MGRRLDAVMEDLLASLRDRPLVVEWVDADEVGSVRIGMSGGYSLELFPDTSADLEHCRLLQPGTGLEHFVVTGHGIES